MNRRLERDDAGYVLCRPMGGLNDSLCQIQKCLSYCQKTGRTLVLDGRFSGFLDDFSRYFIINKAPTAKTLWEAFATWASAKFRSSRKGMPGLRWYSAEWGAKSQQLSCFPHILQGRLSDYEFEYRDGSHFEKSTGERLGFDWDTHYREQVLVHHQCGGGNLSFRGIQWFQLRPEIAAEAKAMLEKLPRYISVHVRNSDLKTEYESLLQRVQKRSPRGHVLVCSDDFQVKQSAARLFGSRLIESTRTPDTSGQPLHYNTSLDRYQGNKDMLIDLVMLAAGRELWVTETTEGYVSGFGSLARHLNRNKRLLRGFLGLSVG